MFLRLGAEDSHPLLEDETEVRPTDTGSKTWQNGSLPNRPRRSADDKTSSVSKNYCMVFPLFEFLNILAF